MNVSIRSKIKKTGPKNCNIVRIEKQAGVSMQCWPEKCLQNNKHWHPKNITRTRHTPHLIGIDKKINENYTTKFIIPERTTKSILINTVTTQRDWFGFYCSVLSGNRLCTI